MKRVLISLIAILYFIISSGLVMNIHYCMGKVSSVQLNKLASKGCKCSKTEKETAPKSCCKTELKVVKLQDSHNASSADYVFQVPVAPISVYTSYIQLPLLNADSKVYADINAPPLLSEQNTYLLNCVFRI